MPKYDAFGREIGDDPLETLRQSAAAPARRVEPAPAEPVERWPDPEPRPVPEAVVAPAQPATPPPPRLQFVRPRRRRRGGMARLVVTLAVLGAAAVALVNVGSSVQGGIEDIVDSLPETVDPGAGPAATGVTGASLIRRANFRSAIATLERARLGRPMMLRVAPDRIDATLLAKGGRLNQVQIRSDGDLRRLGSSDVAPARTLAYDAIDPAAPERLVRAAATRKFPARSIDYVIVGAGPPPFTAAYFKGNRQVLGDAHGRKQRAI